MAVFIVSSETPAESSITGAATTLASTRAEPSLLAREAWLAEEAPGRFRAVLPVLAVGRPAAGGAPYRLTLDGRELAYQAEAEAFGRAQGLPVVANEVLVTAAARSLDLFDENVILFWVVATPLMVDPVSFEE